MKLRLAVQAVFGQLAGSIGQLSPQDYITPCKTLSGNTIGQHVRHIIELFQALENGYLTGVVNYEDRKRDKTLETDENIACLALDQIAEGLGKPDKPLLLEANYDEHSDLPTVLNTNYYREVAYNLEHSIHHMAMIRIGITEVGSHIILPENYGIASSTIKHRKQQCAQ
ncbi:MAG TPA: hypothetical protein VE035_01000 [Puia sp.]|nr:hypothetical protein [Puia sp.]